MNRSQMIYLKRKEQLDIDGEREKRLEKQRKLAEEQKLIKSRLKKIKSGEAANPKKVVDDIFKGKDEEEEVKPKATKRKSSTRRTRKPKVETDVTLEGEEVNDEEEE